MLVCHSCLRDIEAENTFCTACSVQVFGKKKMSAILPLSANDLAEKLPLQLQKNSLVGYQNKIYLKINGTWTVPQWGAVSHLLKLPNTDRISPYKLAADMPANEHLSMQIAKQIFDIPTAECAFMHTEDKLPLYITKLFDVSYAKDFAILLDITSDTHGEDYKYNGSYEEIASYLAQKSEDNQTDIFNFFKSFVFNLVIRNGDAHLRNFSMYYNSQNLFTLTPFYDLLNTVLHIEGKTMACYIAQADKANKRKIDIRSLNKMSRKKILTFATTIGLDTQKINNFLDEIAGKKILIFTLIDRSFLTDRAKQLYRNLVEDSYKVLFRL